jgi:hypothetical protein
MFRTYKLVVNSWMPGGISSYAAAGPSSSYARMLVRTYAAAGPSSTDSAAHCASAKLHGAMQ